MKYLICFLLFSTVAFSQNYHYALEEAQIKTSNVPTRLVASAITQSTVNLAWTAPTDTKPVLGYKIYNNGVLLATSTGTVTNYKLTALTPDTTYSLTVRAFYGADIESIDSNIQRVTTDPIPRVVNNQLEEIEYYKAYLLPIGKKAMLQQALDEHGSVRLEKGDYLGAPIVMKSNQRLYGHPSLTRVPKITIAAGSSNVHLEDLFPGSGNPITLEAGGVISGCTFKSIKWTYLLGTNVMLENNSFINYGGPIQIDCSQSGYIRNNKIIKHQSGIVRNILLMKGNSTTPSYGNVHLHTNFLTPGSDTSDLDNLESATFVGLDSEGWNLNGNGTRAMFYAHNMGSLKISDFGGGNGYSAVKTPSFDIDAANLSFFNKTLSANTDILSLRTNMFLVHGSGTYIRKPGTVTGFNLIGNLDDSKVLKYNGVEQTTSIKDSTELNILSNTILGKQYTPWARPKWETLPDPLGPNWKEDRKKGKLDQTSYIQNLINTKGIAELPEGIFYIGSTLKLPLDRNHGIVGKGTGKTVIVGLTDTFPLISLTGGQDANFILAHLTLQGGSAGIYASQEYGTQHMAYQFMKFIIFRNQNYGMHLNQIMGFDNNFLDNLCFIDCNIGFYQQPRSPFTNIDSSSFIDKTMFYKNQFLNCGTGVSMVPTRPNNLDAWVDCKFDGGVTAIINGGNHQIIANCDFSNFTGDHVIKSAVISIYNSNIYNNKVKISTVYALRTFIEGCKFSDNIKMFVPVISNNLQHHIMNSVITGDVVVNVPPNTGYRSESSIYINSTLSANPELSKLLVNVKDGVPTVVIDAVPNPYPQFLVTH